ncbi:hypothetical protein ACFYZE_12785 [Streptomyces sp. NPDC001796]|uniref:hypothetical protein n=1 Tax=Streptomyces sp. NPDC001796 TaxID=3364609 RepID=UPI0036855D89
MSGALLSDAPSSGAVVHPSVGGPMAGVGDIQPVRGLPACPQGEFEDEAVRAAAGVRRRQPPDGHPITGD